MDVVQDLLTFIVHSPSPFHAVMAGRDELLSAGFTELGWGKPWLLAPGGRYFTRVYGSALLAFRIGEKKPRGLRIAAAHTDFPGFRVKPAAGMVKDCYGLVNVEPYGGLILSSWLDRPLSLAGKVVLRGKSAFAPESYLVDLTRPLLTIPGLAIHMNRAMNDGVKLNRQTEMTPVAAVAEELEKTFFLEKLAREIGHDPEEILSYDLTVYPAETGCRLGFDAELVSSPRLDNLTSVKACLDGLIEAESDSGIRVAALFDNEEVGSHTKQGAASALLEQLLQRIYRALELDADDLAADLAAGFLLSVDVAHALHPNYVEKADPTNQPHLNGGVVLKQAASQAYAGDAEAVAIIAELCREHEIPVQHFVNRSDIPGGATLGSMVSSQLAIRTMDVGVPILAMHSARETMGADDQAALTGLVRAFMGK